MGICVRDLHEICTCSKNEYKEVTELLPLEVPVGGAVQTQKGGIVSPPHRRGEAGAVSQTRQRSRSKVLEFLF